MMRSYCVARGLVETPWSHAWVSVYTRVRSSQSHCPKGNQCISIEQMSETLWLLPLSLLGEKPWSLGWNKIHSESRGWNWGGSDDRCVLGLGCSVCWVPALLPPWWQPRAIWGHGDVMPRGCWAAQVPGSDTCGLGPAVATSLFLFHVTQTETKHKLNRLS